MKKRFKGLFALCLAFAVAVLGAFSNVVYAAEYNVDSSGVNDAGNYVTELFAGDKLIASFTGGFAVIDSTSGKVLASGDTGNQGVPSYYDDGTGTFVQDSNYPYFASLYESNPQDYVVPALGGYHKFTVNNMTNSVDAIKQYCMQIGTVSPNTPDQYPVYFLYLTPVPNTYTVKFDKNNANAQGAQIADQTFTYKTAQNLNANTFSVYAHKFAGWNTKADGSGTSLADGADGSVLATNSNGETVTLYAQWEPIKYTVKFDANGGSGTMADQSFSYGTAQNLTANTFTRDGYTFSGWATMADGTGTTYTDGQSIENLYDTDGASLRLYAQWKAVTTGGAPSGVTKTEINPNFTDADIPQELKDKGVDTVKKIEELLKVEVEKVKSNTANFALYDVILKYSLDGGKTWIIADENHFPADGKLLVSIPVPEGSDPTKHNYIVVHMFTSSAFGKTPGATERPEVTVRKGADGIYYLDFYVTGLSPVMVGWGEKTPETTTTTLYTDEKSPKTGDDSYNMWPLFSVVFSVGLAMVIVRKRMYQK